MPAETVRRQRPTFTGRSPSRAGRRCPAGTAIGIGGRPGARGADVSSYPVAQRFLPSFARVHTIGSPVDEVAVASGRKQNSP
jgi:hypothetical protein